ncbi:hypothetical protein [Phaeacidiphilus oryzae]|uniref:hypothetical protein n=1 Tax=Phaeacidiphilus oryzae TaxID=348818 RepID=UPI00056B4FA1|nr:hypothetical protein [Phaeacidiphilus oryzae]
MTTPTQVPAPADCPDCLALARALTEARRTRDRPAETEIHTRLKHHWSETHRSEPPRPQGPRGSTC